MFVSGIGFGRSARVSYTIAGVGLLSLTDRVTEGRGRFNPREVIYERDGFLLYLVKGYDTLRLRKPTDSERMLRRFLRDFTKSREGAIHSLQYYVQPWR